MSFMVDSVEFYYSKKRNKTKLSLQEIYVGQTIHPSANFKKINTTNKTLLKPFVFFLNICRSRRNASWTKWLNDKIDKHDDRKHAVNVRCVVTRIRTCRNSQRSLLSHEIALVNSRRVNLKFGRQWQANGDLYCYQ